MSTIDELSNLQIATVALALLEGQSEYIDEEDVAIKAHEIAPGRFAWKKYPDRIDLAVVGYSLRDAKKTKNGGLVVGSTSTGWMLSPQGIRWIDSLDLSAIVGAEARKHRQNSVAAVQETEIRRLRSTKAYQLWTSGNLEQITVQDFFQFARINEYFQAKARQKRFAGIDNAVTGDLALTELWEALKTKFSQELT